MGVIVLVVVLTILFISPITKYLVKKYDEELIGRQITIESAYANVWQGCFKYFCNANNAKFNLVIEIGCYAPKKNLKRAKRNGRKDADKNKAQQKLKHSIFFNVRII